MTTSQPLATEDPGPAPPVRPVPKSTAAKPATAKPSGAGAARDRGRAHEDEGDAFQRSLTREILIAERLRVTLLAGIPSFAMISFLAVSAVSPEIVHAVFRAELDRIRVGLFLGVVACYEFYSLFSVEKLIRSEKKPPPLRRYVNAFIETSMPTAVIAYYMTVVAPADALLLPPNFGYFLFILLSTLRLDFLLCAFTGLVAAIEYAALSIAALSSYEASGYPASVIATTQNHFGKALILLVSGIAAGFVARRLRMGFENTLRSLQDRNRIVNVFGQHVSPAVVEQLLAQKADIKSEVRDVCVMFLDIRNFTAFSEKRTPEEVVSYSNGLFEVMVDAVNRHQGIVNKFLGDGFMAVFGAPLPDEKAAEHAVEAGLEIIGHVARLAKEGKIPPTRVGIGVHLGPALLGNVGSGTRKEYTVIGDVVNVASRVETLNKEMKSQMLVTNEVFSATGRSTSSVIEREAVSIRGREKPVRIYELA